MSREGVPEGVRMDAGLRAGVSGPGPQPASDIGRGQPPAAFRDEQGGLAIAAVQRRPAALEVGGDGPQRRLPDRHEAGLAALALDPDLLRVELDGAEIEVDDLLGSEPAGV